MAIIKQASGLRGMPANMSKSLSESSLNWNKTNALW